MRCRSWFNPLEDRHFEFGFEFPVVSAVENYVCERKYYSPCKVLVWLQSSDEVSVD